MTAQPGDHPGRAGGDQTVPPLGQHLGLTSHPLAGGQISVHRLLFGSREAAGSLADAEGENKRTQISQRIRVGGEPATYRRAENVGRSTFYSPASGIMNIQRGRTILAVIFHPGRQ